MRYLYYIKETKEKQMKKIIISKILKLSHMIDLLIDNGDVLGLSREDINKELNKLQAQRKILSEVLKESE